MKLLHSKKGYMDPAIGGFVKGLIIGILIGAVIIYLAHKGIVPIPLP